MKKKYSLIFFIIGFLLIINLFKDLRHLKKARSRLSQTEEKLQTLKEENQQLQKNKQYFSSDVFIEKQIRDKLQMAKPGETIIILPEKIQEREEEEQEQQDQKKIWQKWLELFF